MHVFIDSIFDILQVGCMSGLSLCIHVKYWVLIVLYEDSTLTFSNHLKQAYLLTTFDSWPLGQKG